MLLGTAVFGMLYTDSRKLRAECIDTMTMLFPLRLYLPCYWPSNSRKSGLYIE